MTLSPMLRGGSHVHRSHSVRSGAMALASGAHAAPGRAAAGGRPGRRAAYYGCCWSSCTPAGVRDRRRWKWRSLQLITRRLILERRLCLNSSSRTLISFSCCATSLFFRFRLFFRFSVRVSRFSRTTRIQATSRSIFVKVRGTSGPIFLSVRMPLARARPRLS